MNTPSRDLGVVCAITAGIVVSLLIARLLTTSDPPAAADPSEPTASADWATTGPGPSTTAAPLSGTVVANGGPTPTTAPPQASMMLSGGVPVVPRPAPARSYRPAPTSLPATSPQPPSATADPAVYADPAALGTAWLAAMCWYDYRTGPDENTRLAAAYGDTSMPAAGNPWVLDEKAWTQITSAQLGSGCTDIVATPAHAAQESADQDTVTLTATQVLAVDGIPYQAVPIRLTRTLQHGPDGHWLIGPAVTAN